MNPEVVGILATCFVLLSFLMWQPRHIRLINLVGAALYCFYGYLIGSLSTLLLNGALIMIHTYYLVKRK